MEFRFLENSALAIVDAIVLGRLKRLQPLYVIFLVAKKLTISPFCHSSSQPPILRPFAGVDKIVGILVLEKVAWMKKQVEMIRSLSFSYCKHMCKLSLLHALFWCGF